MKQYEMVKPKSVLAIIYKSYNKQVTWVVVDHSFHVLNVF